MDMFDLIDIQKVKHPNDNKFSYRSKAMKMKCRIDLFLLANHLRKYVHKADIQSYIAPDHNLVCVFLQWENEITRGPGFWKFNNSLLKDENFVQQIRNLYPVFQRKYKDVNDKQIFWELLKLEIRMLTISYVKGKAKLRKSREVLVKDELDELHNKICSSQDLQNMKEELKKYDVLKKELQELYEGKGEAAKFRAKCAWREKGERPTKYFFNLEKRNYNKKVIFELEDDANNIITSDKEILLQIENYYSNLYSSNICETEEKLSQFSENLNLPRLSNKDGCIVPYSLSFQHRRAKRDYW